MGFLTTFSGLGALGMSFLTGGQESPFPFETAIFDVMFAHMKLISSIQSAVGFFMVFAALMFLRHKLWALFALAVFCVLDAVWVATFGFYWVKLLLSMGDNNQPIAQIFTSAMAGMGILVMLLMAAMFLLCLWFLRDQRVLVQFRKPDSSHG